MRHELFVKGGSAHPTETTIKLGDRDLPITMDTWEKRAGNRIVHVNPEKFDKAFKNTSWQYVGPQGEGGIKDRYSKFADHAKSAKSAHASNVDVNKEGAITFGDGRHRYAYMRDQGLSSIPMSMDKQSIEHARRHGYLHEAKGGSVMGINVASDRKAGRSYADMIVDGHKTLESRNSDTLRPYVGKRVAIVRTGEGKAKAIGEVTIGEPIVANKKQFRNLESHHLVPEGSTFDIKTETKHMYPLSDPVRYEQERDVGHGIVSRKVIEKAKGGKVDVRPTVQDPNLQRRIPEMEDAAKAFHSGEMSKKDYDKVVNKNKPVKAYDFVPKPASDEDAKRALMANKQEKWRGHESWPSGHKVGLRLDIPAYEHHGVWVNSIHDETADKRPTSYGPVSSVKNAEFDPKPEKGIRVATGEQNKAPFARIVGELHHMHEDEAVKHAQKYLNHPEWTQVGYDPRRHGYFYDRKTMKPVSHAEHVVQIGPLVLAKNVKHKKADSYSSGGITHLASGGNVLHNQGAHMKPTLAQMRLKLADGGSTCQSDAAKNLKSMYGIDNPALLSYIGSNQNLSGDDLKNLGATFNSKTPQQLAVAQQGNDSLQSQANAIVSHDATVKSRLSDPTSYIYNKNVYDPTKDPKRQSMNLTQSSQDNQYSSLFDPNNTSPSASLNEINDMYKNQLDTKFDQFGNRHIQTTQGTYTFDKTGKPLGFNLLSSDPRSQVQQQAFGNANQLANANNYDQFGMPYAEGGTVNQRPMSEPNLAQMRLEMGRHKNPQVMGNIGVDEAVDIDPKIFVNPNPNSPGLPDVGGVKTPDGALPVGGVDMNPQQAGQQMMPQAPQAPQAPQQGQPQGAPPSMAPAGSGAPQGPSNILSLTPQGQAMNAMRPPQGPMAQKMAKGGQPTIAQMKNELHHFAQGGSEKDDGSSTRIHVPARGPKGIKGIKVPRHMWEGKVYGGVGPKKGQKVEGMKDVNEARSEVYGSEHRQPLNIGQIGKAHRQALNEHFAKPLEEQTAAEKEALDRLRKAKHIGSKANTLDESEKLDTVRHETDDEGRTHVGYASKGVAGYALYTSGHGKDAEHHILNTCPGQTDGCGGGMDENGVVDTSKGTCFAPNAESQYVNAAVRRASHAQAKHDPAMTRDWILAHTGSLREAANQADKKNQRLLFRPNVVDESDTSSRHVLRHLNEQRKKDDKPPIIANSYGKTNELHDPENGYHVTHSNVGPKTKHGKEVSENIGRDKARVRNTILAHDNKGHFTNEQGNKTPPKNSYMVTNVKRGSPFDKEMQNTITHAKYWSQGRPLNELNEMEKDEGEEGHYNAKGQRTTPDKSHYGHAVVNGNRYDYQKQHILHPRLVQVGTNKDGTPHMIPTDSRFLDNKELDKTIPREKQFKTRNGKRAGLILMTTPTESTPNHLHHSSFTHDVNPTHIEYAKKNNGEYEIDPPLAQEFSKGKEYVAPQPIKIMRKAKGGQVIGHKMEYNDDFNAFPEQDFLAQHHLAARRANKV